MSEKIIYQTNNKKITKEACEGVIRNHTLLISL